MQSTIVGAKCENKGDHFLIDGRYAIYKNDGCVYDTLKAKDIPQRIFVIRDELIGQHSSSTCLECGQLYFKGEDARVDAGMKCGRCAYGNSGELATN